MLNLTSKHFLADTVVTAALSYQIEFF